MKVSPIFYYGAKTWMLSAAQEERVESMYTHLLRVALNVPWNAYLSNKVIYKTTKKKRLTEELCDKRRQIVNNMVTGKVGYL